MRATRILLSIGLGLAVMGNLGGCPFLDIIFPPTNGDPNQPTDPNTTDPNTTDPNVADPNATDPNDTTTEKSLHERIFTEIVTSGYQGTASCLACHSTEGLEILDTAHWKWEGTVANIEGLEGTTHGKKDLLNNFCIAVPSNEGRCSQCHPSYGWKDDTFDFDSTANMDCLVCHDTTGTYSKHPSANGGGGQPALPVDGVQTVVTAAELQEVAYSVGEPTRRNCGLCHFYAGGGDNVKHGDLSSDLIDPTATMDVHMGGLDFTCQECHTTVNHGIAGMPLHSVDEGGGIPTCTDSGCHNAESPHADDPLLATLLNNHTDRIACQTCHIPTFARSMPTKVEWYWDEAGQDIDPIPTDEYGKATYDKKKGRFVWEKNVSPTLMWYNHKWQRKVLNVSDTYTEAGTVADPVVMAKPTATIDDDDAKIYPFKKMIGRQPADTENDRLIVPHLFPGPAGDNAYWKVYDWGLALAEGAAYAGQEYSGTYGFVNTVMYLTVNHEIAPADQALVCDDCHGQEGFFEALGYDEDPFGSN